MRRIPARPLFLMQVIEKLFYPKSKSSGHIEVSFIVTPQVHWRFHYHALLRRSGWRTIERKPSRPIPPIPMCSCLSLCEPRVPWQSLRWTRQSLFGSMQLINSSRVFSRARGVRRSYPAANRWQVSRHTPRLLDWPGSDSMMEAISMNVLPMLFFVPALFSKRTTASLRMGDGALQGLCDPSLPFSFPWPRSLPRWVTTYGMPRS